MATLFNINENFSIYVCVLSACLYVHHVHAVLVEDRVSDLEPELQMVVWVELQMVVWVLGIEAQSSGRPGSDLNC